ncbi:MAG: Glu/Leu/Phe/Val dehydrogenase dimerization domain-containing protein [Pseudomonadota bacterium]
MAVFSSPAFDGHEKVAFWNDEAAGLRSIIAVHSTAAGPSAGGCRIWSYANDADALTDVLRLSRGMSYKNIMAGLRLGGGKAVIVGDRQRTKTPAMMRSFGRFVESLGGLYYTAEDVGMSAEDMEYVAEETRYVAGRSKGANASGDPSPFTAHGVFCGIEAALAHRFGTPDWSSRTIAIQGLGHVGYHLARELADQGAKLIVADIHEANVARVVSECGARAVSPDEIISVRADVFSPCALGAVVNETTIAAIKADIIAGAANNQLAEDRHGEMLRARDILYVPDYVINAGGIMNVSLEIEGRFENATASMRWVEHIGVTLTELFARADREARPTNVIADEMARERIAAAKRTHGSASEAAE